MIGLGRVEPLSVAATLLLAQRPAADLVLPYASSWDVEVTVVEHWTSVRPERNNLRTATVNDRVSILPLEQWQPSRLSMRVRLVSGKDNINGAWVRAFR